MESIIDMTCFGLNNIQKITCIILRNLFGLDLFSHQSCATGTLLLQKKIYPRKSSLNLKQLIFFMFLKLELFCENVRHLATSSIFVMRKAFRLSSCRRSGGRSYHLLRRIPGETVLKVKVPPVRIENSLSPLYGYRLFYSRRDFSDSLGEAVLKVKVPLVRIENSLSPLYGGTDFSTLAETFQTVSPEDVLTARFAA